MTARRPKTPTTIPIISARLLFFLGLTGGFVGESGVGVMIVTPGGVIGVRGVRGTSGINTSP